MSAEVALRISQAPVVAGPENVAAARECLKVGKIATLEFALRCKAEKDGPGSKTNADVAADMGCGLRTVERALSTLSKIAKTAQMGGWDDLELVWDVEYNEARRGEAQPRPSAKASTSASDDGALDGEVVPGDYDPWSGEPEDDGWRPDPEWKPEPAQGFNRSGAEVLEAYFSVDLLNALQHMAKLAAAEGALNDVQARVVALVERIFDEARH